FAALVVAPHVFLYVDAERTARAVSDLRSARHGAVRRAEQMARDLTDYAPKLVGRSRLTFTRRCIYTHNYPRSSGSQRLGLKFPYCPGASLPGASFLLLLCAFVLSVFSVSPLFALMIRVFVLRISCFVFCLLSVLLVKKCASCRHFLEEKNFLT